MSTTMTNQPGMLDDGAFSKAASTVMAGLGEMFKAAHKRDPQGESATLIHDIMSQVSDLEATYEGVGTAAPEGMMADPEAAVTMPPEEMAQMDSDAAGGPPTSMDDAGAQLEEMLKMSNKRRPSGGGY